MTAIKDVAADDIFFMTWLVKCAAHDENGQLVEELFYHSTQDIYDPEAPYVLSQEANDDRLLEQIGPAWVMEKYSTISDYLMELAIKYVHKQCVRHGTKNMADYFYQWIQHTAELVATSNDSLGLRNIVLNYDIDSLCRNFRPNKYFLLFSGKDHTYQELNVRLKDFFSIELKTGSIAVGVRQVSEGTEFALQSIADRYDLFVKSIIPHGFMELDKVKCLTTQQRNKLIKNIIQAENTPYAVAMLHFLGLSEKLKSDKFIKEKQYEIISKALAVSPRTVKGNFLTLTNSESKENRLKYPACDKDEVVKLDYNNILNNS
jgi:hypothetical protein